MTWHAHNNNLGTKRTGKLTKYKQLAFETRERRPGNKISVVINVVGALGAGIKALKILLFAFSLKLKLGTGCKISIIFF